MVALLACCAVSLPLRANCVVGSSFRAFPVLVPSRLFSRRWPCSAYLSKEEDELQEGRPVVRTAAVLASEMGVEKDVLSGQSFLNAKNEEELLSCIQKEAEAGTISSNVTSGMEELYYSYKRAVLQSRSPLADEIVLSNMSIALDRILLDVKDPFTFSSYHKALREPFDYFMFGQNYFRPLINFRSSYVGNIHVFKEIEEKVQKGHNIVLISNHQTEADPYIIALLLESTSPQIAEETTYIAGDRVVTDPLCKPFSMGRNLLCVHSKKHLYDFPELVEMKKRANTKSLKELALLLRTAGQIVWIAPSGGRDRPDPVTGEWYPAPFDVSSVDSMRRLADYSSVPAHAYPLALLCYDIMPPPAQVEKKIGERRQISFHGVGLSIGPEMNFDKIRASSGNPEKFGTCKTAAAYHVFRDLKAETDILVYGFEAKMDFSQALYNSVTEQYNVLKAAIHGCQGRNASNSVVSLSQPWKE